MSGRHPCNIQNGIKKSEGCLKIELISVIYLNISID